MAERKITMFEASSFRMQAMLEQLLRLHCEMYAHMANKDFKEIYDLVWKEVDASTKELISNHSHLQDDADPSAN